MVVALGFTFSIDVDEDEELNELFPLSWILYLDSHLQKFIEKGNFKKTGPTQKKEK